MKKTKKALITSLFSMLICVAMLVGSTMAWFTDTASNTGNRIQAGNLKIDLLMDKTVDDGDPADYESIKDGIGDIFLEAGNANNSSYTLWEPGKTQIVYLAVENAGNLAVKYNVYIDVSDFGLCDDGDGNSSLEYALFDEATFADYLEMQTAGVDTWTELKALATETGDVVDGRQTISTGVLDEITNGTTNERDYVALAVHMKEDADNDYQDKHCIIDVSISATQLDSENDGFGTNTYDANLDPAESDYVKHDSITQTIDSAENTVYVSDYTIQGADGLQTTVTIPKETVGFGDGLSSTLDVEATPLLAANQNSTFNIVDAQGSVGAIDLTVKVNGNEITEFEDENGNPVSVTVVTYIAKGLTLNNVEDTIAIKYVGTGNSDPTLVSYDTDTGRLEFTTTHFSTFAIGADQVAYNERLNMAYLTLADAVSDTSDENGKIQDGDTIIMIKDHKIDDSCIAIVNNSITLDLYKHTISTTVDHGRCIVAGAGSDLDDDRDDLDIELTIKGDGTFSIPTDYTESWGFIDLRGDASKLNLQETTMIGTTNDGAFVRSRGYNQIINVNKCDVSLIRPDGYENVDDEVENQYGINAGFLYNDYNVKLTVEDSDFFFDTTNPTRNLFNIYDGSTNKATLTNVKIETTAVAYEIYGMEAEYNNCEIGYPNGNGWVSTAVSVSGNGSVVVNGGTYEGENAVYIWPSGGYAIINSGTFTGDEYAVIVGTDNDDYTNESIATINGGTFSGKLKAYSDAGKVAKIVINDGTFNDVSFEVEGTGASIVITGGTFDTDPTSYVSEGYDAIANGDGTYTVISMTTVNDYATMLSLINDATDDVNIKLGTDIVVNSNTTQLFDIDGINILIDLDGHTIQSTSTGKIFNIANGMISIINSASTQGTLQANTPFRLTTGADVDIKGNVLVKNKAGIVSAKMMTPSSPAFFVVTTATDWRIAYDSSVTFGASDKILNLTETYYTKTNEGGRIIYQSVTE